MIKLLCSMITLFFSCSLIGQQLTLTQQKLPDDFVVHNGPYNIYFHKKDMLQALSEIDSKLKMDHTTIKKLIADGTLTEIIFTPGPPSFTNIKGLMNTSLGCYLLLKSKATVYKGKQLVKVIAIEEAPPEADLDGTITNVFFFSEPGNAIGIFNGSILSSLR